MKIRQHVFGTHMPRGMLHFAEAVRARCSQNMYFEIDEDLFEGDRQDCLTTIVREASEIILRVDEEVVRTTPGKTEDGAGMCYGALVSESFEASFKLEAGKPWRRMDLAMLVIFVIEGEGCPYFGPLREDGRL